MVRSKGLFLNPVYLVFFIYFSSNTFYFYKAVGDGGFKILGEFHHVSYYSYLLSYLVFVLFFFGALLLFLVFSSELKVKNFLRLDFSWSVILVLYLTVYTLFSWKTGAGVLGAERNLVNGFDWLLNYFFKVFNPDLIAILILPIVKSRRLFFLGLAVFTSSMMMRGWMSGVYLAGLIYLIRFYPVKVGLKSVLIFVLVCLLIPFLEGLKWGVRGGYDLLGIIESVFNSYDYELIISALVNVSSRFQHINNVAFIIEGREHFIDSFNYGNFREIYQNGVFYDIYCNVTGDCLLDLNQYIVNNFYDIGATWNVDPGVSGWLLLSPCALVVIFFLCVFFIFLISRSIGFKQYLSLWVMFYIYFLHGWIAPFFNILLISAFFYIFLRYRFRIT